MKVLVHAHTTFSRDGELEPEELAALAADRGFGAVLVTDHFEDLDGERFARLRERCRAVAFPLLVPGYERSFDGYHVLALGPRSFVEAATVTAWSAGVRQAGGLVVAAHPSRYGHVLPPPILAACDGVEVWNSKFAYDGVLGPDPRATPLLEGWRLALCGQDLHGRRHASPVAVELAGEPVDAAGILATLRRGAFQMTNGLYTFRAAPRGPVLWVVHGVRRRLVRLAVVARAALRRVAGPFLRRAAPGTGPHGS